MGLGIEHCTLQCSPARAAYSASITSLLSQTDPSLSDGCPRKLFGHPAPLGLYVNYFHTKFLQSRSCRTDQKADKTKSKEYIPLDALSPLNHGHSAFLLVSQRHSLHLKLENSGSWACQQKSTVSPPEIAPDLTCLISTAVCV